VGIDDAAAQHRRCAGRLTPPVKACWGVAITRRNYYQACGRRPMKLMRSVVFLLLSAASFQVGCAKPVPEPPSPAPEPEVSATSEAVDEPAGQPPAREPTRASESEYNQDITKATTSEGLTKADIAWHALNTYGWDCEEVVSREPQVKDYFVVVCSSGTKLRVYPRTSQHPRITNSSGGYN
jgi:hypothetical protein